MTFGSEHLLNWGIDTSPDTATLRFQIACPECQAEGASSLVIIQFHAYPVPINTLLTESKSFEMAIYETSRVCSGNGIWLNGNELSFVENGTGGQGSGFVPAIEKANDGYELLVSWESACLTGSSEEATREAAQILVVNIQQAGALEPKYDVGFTISFSQFERPKFLRFCPHPLKIFDGDLESSAWLLPHELDCIDVDNRGETDIERHWKELQDLQAQMRQLQVRIKEEEHYIREKLHQDCPEFWAPLKQCEGVECMVKAGLRVIPYFFRQLKYRFGPLPSTLPKGRCRQYQNHTGCPPGSDRVFERFATRPTKQMQSLNSSLDDEMGNPGIIDLPPPFTIPPHVNPGPSLDIPQPDPVKSFMRTCAIILLVMASSTLALRLYRNKGHFVRHRAECAARREERSSRRSNSNAARRLRRRQWWESRSYQTMPRSPSAHSLAEMNPLEEDEMSRSQNETDLEANRRFERGERGAAMHAELLSLRRVLDFVGELVRDSDQDSDIDRPPQYSHHDLPGYVARQYTNAPSSTAGLTTLDSPRTSSLSTMDTVSSLTIDTLDSAETGPPSYTA